MADPDKEFAANITKDIMVAYSDNISTSAIHKVKDLTEEISKSYEKIYDTVYKKIKE